MLVDGFVYGQGFFSIVVAFVAVAAGLPRALFALARGDRTTARLRASRIAVYVVAAVVVVTSVIANGQMARRRADLLIVACRQYEARHGRLPDRLEDLVPEFIPGVPRAKYVTNPVVAQFSYSAHGGKHRLMWVAFPPFGRPYYVFEENRWGYLD